MTDDRRRALLVVALGFARVGVRPEPPVLRALRGWLGSWIGVGVVVEGLIGEGFDLALVRHGDGGPQWRALFYPSAFLHRGVSGEAWGVTPWRAVQDAAWAALHHPAHGSRRGTPRRAYRRARR